MKVRDKLYIDGAWVEPSGKGTIDVVNAATEEVMGRVPEGNNEDVNKAVEAAKIALESWSQISPEERGKFIQRLSEALGARMEEIGTTVAGEVGMPLNLAKMIQAGLPTMVMGSYANILTEFEWEEQVGNSLVVKEPVGVVACITPWNYPLHQTVAKVAPAIAAGCTVVHKPAAAAPLSAFILAEIMEEVGLPAGVYNLVSGAGRVIGEAMVSHPDVNMVSFTGSTTAGRRVAELAAQSIKRVALELGGKSANVILDDADLAVAVKAGVSNCYLNSGQTCTAWTRLLVPQDRHDEAVKIAKEVAESFKVGPPDAADTRLGPLCTKDQQETVRKYINRGVEEGATLVTGGPEQPEGLDKGYYVKPTVFANVKSDMTIAQEEIFGPVLSILPYKDEDDAVRIANDSIYGLAGGVWAADPERAKKVARRIRTGQVDINGGRFNPTAPFGGFKQSGIGRELGKHGLEEFLEIKSLQL